MTDERYLKRTIFKEILYCSSLGENRRLRIYVPPGYNELLTYPVLYCQDGEQFFNFGRVATTATRLILDEGLEPFIIVGIEVDLSERTAEYAPFGERFRAYTTCLANDIIPYVEAKYAVRQDRTKRIVAGDSLGGSFSVHLAVQYPELFCNVISLSGAFYQMSQQMFARETDLSHLNIWMIVGLQEMSFETDTGTFDFVQLNRATQHILQARGASIFYEEKEGRHQWGFWQKELPNALLYFLNKA